MRARSSAGSRRQNHQTAAELDELDHPRKRRRVRRRVRRQAGPRAAKLLKRLQREQVNLAMVRAHVGSAEHADLVAALQEGPHEVRTDEPGASGDEHERHQAIASTW